MSVVVIDYGAGNLRSMYNALVRALPHTTVTVSGAAEALRSAERLVLPGVGAFAACRRRLDESGVLAPLLDAVARKTPLLGVCVGLQVLATEGTEFERCAGLNLVPGTVKRLPVDAGRVKLPHIGFAPIRHDGKAPFDVLDDADEMYFVHSYAIAPDDSAHVAARATTGPSDADVEFVAAVRCGAIIGTQFHPEKSGEAGLRFLRAFSKWSGR